MVDGVGVAGPASLGGRRAVVTGASSGMGVDLARELASRGADLVLVARRRENLERVAGEIRARTGVEVEVRPADLGRPADRLALVEELTSGGRNVDVLIDNAGLGLHGAYEDLSWDAERAMLEPLTLPQRVMQMPSAEVARQAVRGLLAGRAFVVPGRLNAFMVFGLRFLPRGLATRLTHAMIARRS